ncbi:MAG: DNA polymerase I, partial [Butyrivibrio sp.]|nr:DNA polymerase I [Butyrivibrio sp.]
MAEKLVLIDGHSIINRAFYGVPDLTNASGLHTGAIYGFLNIFFKLIDEEKPDYVVVAFDEHAKTFRHQIFDQYKGTRKPMPDELRQQVPVLRDVLSAMNVVTCSKEGLEADDILGTLAKKSASEGMKVILVSGDRDLLQISDESITIRIPRTKQGKTTYDDFDPARVKEDFGVSPAGFIELKALMGDTADNIPGVPKVGEKTARTLMETYGSIEGIYEHIDEIKGNSVRESLRENRALADLSLKLATIITDADVELDKEKASASDFYTAQAYDIIKELGLKSFYSRFDDSAKSSVSNAQSIDRPAVKVAESFSEFAKAVEKCSKQEAGFHFVF